MIEYSVWGGSIDELRAYNSLLNLVFEGRNVEPEYLAWKHLENPLGPSIITIAKCEGNIIGARALQYTLAVDECFFQPCDTVTHPDFQRRGVITELTNLALRQIPSGSPVLNFPNKFSLPAYKKMGWKVHQRLKPRIGFNPLYARPLIQEVNYSRAKEEVAKLQDQQWKKYCQWRFFKNPRQNYRYFLSRGRLTVVNVRRMAYTIFTGDSSISSASEKILPFLCYTYDFEESFGLIEKAVHRLTGRGSNIVALKPQDYSILRAAKSSELSGLMDTF